jgi:hypothetical protein
MKSRLSSPIVNQCTVRIADVTTIHSTLPVTFGTTSHKVFSLKAHDDSKGCDYETYIFVKDEEVVFFCGVGLKPP